MNTKRLIPVLAILVIAALAFAGCSKNQASDGQKQEHETQQQIEDNYAKAQPVPALTNSQVRENLIEIEEAVAEGVSTTSFFYELGIPKPLHECPSIGVPIPITAQLTNPEQIINPPGDASAANLPQMDPTGIYTGDGEGTYVLCIDATGEAYVFYWEGHVGTVFAPAKYENGKIELLGKATWDFSEHTAPSGTDPTNNPEG